MKMEDTSCLPWLGAIRINATLPAGLGVAVRESVLEWIESHAALARRLDSLK